MVECLLEGIETTSLKVVNLIKLNEVTQGPDENPAAFLNRLTEALTTYSWIAPDSPAGVTTLVNRFIFQSASDIRRKLSKVEDGPQIPLQDLVKWPLRFITPERKPLKPTPRQSLNKKPNYRLTSRLTSLGDTPRH